MGFRVKARGSQEITVTGMSTGAGDMARQSEPAALPQDLGLGLSTHDVSSQQPVIPAPRTLMPSFGISGLLHSFVHEPQKHVKKKF